MTDADRRPDPSVSVVIPHYGKAAPTVALVHLALSEDAVREVIVVDDCSPEPLPDVDGATVIRREVNGGFGSAVNTGAARASGELLLLLNSDVTFAPGFVSRLIGTAAPWQPAVVGPAVVTDGVTEHTARRFPQPRFQAVERVQLLARWRDREWWARAIGQDLRARPGSDLAVDWVAGVCLLLPRAEFERVGGFDERFFMYAEEVDLQRRLADAGVARVYLGSLSVDHVGGASSDPARAHAWLLESRLTYAAKWGGTPRLRLLLTGASLVNAATDGARRVAGRDLHPGRDLGVALRGIWGAAQRAR